MIDEATTERRSIRLSDRRLGYLYAAVEAKSVRGAADKLEVEPSVVSRQIQLLERELDSVLLARHGRGVIATEAAGLIIDYYRRRLLDEATLLSQLEELKGLQRGDVHVVTSEGFIESFVETVMSTFGLDYPGIKITLGAMPAAQIVRAVADQQVNIGLVFAPSPNNGVDVFARKRHPLHVIARNDHPIARQDAIRDMHALAGLPFCLVPEEFGIGKLTKMAEQASQVALTRAMETNSLQALRHYVTSGLGLTILPKILVQRELDAGLVKAVRLRNSVFETAEGQIIVPRKTLRSVAEEAMLLRLVRMDWFT